MNDIHGYSPFMTQYNFRDIDLNLLPIFKFVYEERNTTRASEKMGVTQSAVSHALTRLRNHFDDPLFVRSQRGLDPTPKADELYSRIDIILGNVEGLLGEKHGFDASTSRRVFKIGIARETATVVLTRLIPFLNENTPGIRVNSFEVTPDTATKELVSGAADLIITPIFDEHPQYIQATPLFHSDFICAATPDHPAFERNLNMVTYLNARHIQLALPGHDSHAIENILKKRGLERDIQHIVADYPTALQLAKTGEYILTEPRCLLAPLIPHYGLAVVETPFKSPNFPVSMAWHAKYQEDSSLTWLRETVQTLLGSRKKEEVSASDENEAEQEEAA